MVLIGLFYWIGAGEVLHVAWRGTRKLRPSIRKWKKRRPAIEAVIGHAKTDGRLGRNFLKGREGDNINAILSGGGYKIRKSLKVLLFYIFFFRQRSLLTVRNV